MTRHTQYWHRHCKCFCIPCLVSVEIFGGQDWSQYPQYPLPGICSKFSSIFVEHQYLSSGSVSVMHPCFKTPLNLKGNLHWAFLSGLSFVVKHWLLARFPEDWLLGRLPKDKMGWLLWQLCAAMMTWVATHHLVDLDLLTF